MRILSWLLLLVLTAMPAWAGKVALVIGNNDYRNVGPVERAVADARALRDHLRDERGFEIVYVENGDNGTMAGSVTWFLSKLHEGDTALIFYGGHGVQIDRSLYILPVDFPATGPGQGGAAGFLMENAIEFASIRRRVAKEGVALSISIFDSCRQNPFANAVRSSRTGIVIGPADKPGLARVPVGGDFAIFSSAPGECPLESTGAEDNDPNSVFARVFLKAFRPGAYLEDVMNEVQAEVLKLSRGVQVPYYTDGVPGWTCIDDGCGTR